MNEPFAMSLDHFQLAIPAGSEDSCRAFYVGILGMTEVAKPLALAGRGGLWLQTGALSIHLGVDVEFVPARKAHPGFRVADVHPWAERLVAHDVEIA